VRDQESRPQKTSIEGVAVGFWWYNSRINNLLLRKVATRVSEAVREDVLRVGNMDDVQGIEMGCKEN
jgi:hypothetical protein